MGLAVRVRSVFLPSPSSSATSAPISTPRSPSCSARSGRWHESFCVKIQKLFLIVNCLLGSIGALLIGGCCCIFSNPFPSIPTPISQVNVAYSSPKIDSTNNVAYFVKTVTQEYKELLSKSKGFGFVHEQFDGYEMIVKRNWTKNFLCQSKADGSQPKSLCDLFGKEYSSDDARYRPDEWDSWISDTINGFDVFWKQQKVLVFLHVSTNNLLVYDLRTGIPALQTFRSGQYGVYLYISLFDDDRKVLLGGYDDYCCIDLNDNSIRTNVFKNINKQFISRPIWNEKEKCFAVVVNPYHASIYDDGFQVIDTISGDDLHSARRAKMQKKQPPPRKYPWVDDWLWNYTLWPHHPESNVEFKLKTHTIEHKRVSPATAASIW